MPTSLGRRLRYGAIRADKLDPLPATDHDIAALPNVNHEHTDYAVALEQVRQP
jgi:hypothetical protein